MELLRSIFAQIGINKTVYIQFLLVVIVCLFLSKMLFKPVMMILIARKHKTLGLRKMAEDTVMDAEKADEEFSKKWNEYEDKARGIKNQTYEKSSKQANDMIKDANKRATQILEKKRDETALQMKNIEAVLDKDISGISDSAEKKLIDGGRI